MFGSFFYITKKGNKCAVEESGGCFFTPNEFEKKKYLKRDLQIFPEFKEKELVYFNKESILSKMRKSDVIVFSDLDNMDFTTYSGVELETFGKVIENYVAKSVTEKKVVNFFSKRCNLLSQCFGLKIVNTKLNDEYAPKYWIITLDSGLSKIDSIKSLNDLSKILNDFKNNFSKLEDKPAKWSFKNNQFILSYNITNKIINYFKAKKVYREHDHPQYKFEDYYVHMSSLHTKADGSLYFTAHSFLKPNKPVTEGNCTSTSFTQAPPDVVERFKLHIVEEYNCKLIEVEDKRDIFFEVL